MSEDIASRPQIRISVTKRCQNGGSTSGAAARTRQHDAEPDPVARRAAGRTARLDGRHFGVGTNRPVGRTSMVRTSTTKDTITAWAGLTTIAA